MSKVCTAKKGSPLPLTTHCSQYSMPPHVPLAVFKNLRDTQANFVLDFQLAIYTLLPSQRCLLKDTHTHEGIKREGKRIKKRKQDQLNPRINRAAMTGHRAGHLVRQNRKVNCCYITIQPKPKLEMPLVMDQGTALLLWARLG